MKSKLLIFIVLAILIFKSSGQNRYALLIGGPIHDHIFSYGDPVGYDYQPGWFSCGDHNEDMFWKDVYLMWELLTQKFQDPYPVDNVKVLFEAGTDFQQDGQYGIPCRYRVGTTNCYQNIPKITDYSCTKDGLSVAVNELSNIITENDFLFVFVSRYIIPIAIHSCPYYPKEISALKCSIKYSNHPMVNFCRIFLIHFQKTLRFGTN